MCSRSYQGRRVGPGSITSIRRPQGCTRWQFSLRDSARHCSTLLDTTAPWSWVCLAAQGEEHPLASLADRQLITSTCLMFYCLCHAQYGVSLPRSSSSRVFADESAISLHTRAEPQVGPAVYQRQSHTLAHLKPAYPSLLSLPATSNTLGPLAHTAPLRSSCSSSCFSMPSPLSNTSTLLAGGPTCACLPVHDGLAMAASSTRHCRS